MGLDDNDIRHVKEICHSEWKDDIKDLQTDIKNLTILLTRIEASIYWQGVAFKMLGAASVIGLILKGMGVV